MRQAGFVPALSPAGGLLIEPASKLTPEQRAYIRAHKVLLLEELRAEAANDAPLVATAPPPGKPAQPDPYRPNPAPPATPAPSPWTDAQLTTPDDSRQPSDNLLTTQDIDSDEGIYIEGFSEVNNYLADIAEAEHERAAFDLLDAAALENVGAESGKPCGENEQGRQFHQNQVVRLSEGCQKVVRESSEGRRFPADSAVSKLSGDAAMLAPVLALYRGAETDKRLAQKMGWDTARLVGAVQGLVNAGFAESRSGMVRPTGRLVAEEVRDMVALVLTGPQPDAAEVRT